MKSEIRLRISGSMSSATNTRMIIVEHSKRRVSDTYQVKYSAVMKTSELIYDWNQALPANFLPRGPVKLNDETLRDGLQSPSVRDPSIEEKIEILHLMEALGINSLELGLPGAGPRAIEHVEALAREIATCRMKSSGNCTARTHQNDIRPIAETVQRTGLNIE